MRTLLLAAMLVVPVAAQMPLPTTAPLPDLPDVSEEEPPEPEPCLDPWMHELIQESQVPVVAQNTPIWRTMICDWAMDVRNATKAYVSKGTWPGPGLTWNYLGNAHVLKGAPFTIGWRFLNNDLLPIELALASSVNTSPLCKGSSAPTTAFGADGADHINLYPTMWVQVLNALAVNMPDAAVGTLTGSAPADMGYHVLHCDFSVPFTATNALETQSHAILGGLSAYPMGGEPLPLGEVFGKTVSGDDILHVGVKVKNMTIYSTLPQIEVLFEVTAEFIEADKEFWDHDYMRIEAAGMETNIKPIGDGGDSVNFLSLPHVLSPGKAEQICIEATLFDDELLSGDAHETTAQAQACTWYLYSVVGGDDAMELANSLVPCRAAFGGSDENPIDSCWLAPLSE